MNKALISSQAFGWYAAITLAASFAFPGYMASHNLPLPWAWLGCLVLQVVFCLIVGLGINCRVAGMFIDNRNRVSLSKFQTTAWTILILSALVTTVFARLAHNVSGAMEITLNPELLAVMGISVTSLVASPLILSVKSGQNAAPGQVEATQARLGDDEHASTGKVYARETPAKASWLDMLRGEEVSNAASPDLGKVQQFLITVILLVGYGGALWAMFSTPFPAGKEPWMAQLPDFGEKMVWLLGISHGGYLAYKAAPHSGSQNAQDTKTVSDGAVG